MKNLLIIFTLIISFTIRGSHSNIIFRTVNGYGDSLVSKAISDVSALPPEGCGTVKSPTGKTWHRCNLGATRVATSSTDHLSYGSLYQWGRGSDGHQLINWTASNAGVSVNGSTTNISTIDLPGHSSFIVIPISSIEWRNPQNANLWQGASGINNPCPAGFRVPTKNEWQAELTALSITNTASAYNSILKLPVAGYRTYNKGTLYNTASYSYYWSSTHGTYYGSDYLSFGRSSASTYNTNGANGYSVRCIQN